MQQATQQNSISGHSSSTRLNSDTYTSSAQSTSAADDTEMSIVPGVPQSALTALSGYTSPMDQAWKTLTQSLKVGDLATAKTALDDYTKSLATSNVSMSAWTTPSNKFLDDLLNLGDVLKSGSLADARTAFAKAADQAPLTAAQVVRWTESKASFDGWMAVYAMKHAGSAPMSHDALAADMAALDAALREMGANITQAFVALGYSQSDSETYSTALTGVTNGTAEENAQLDQTRSEQWIKALAGYAKGVAVPNGYSNAASGGDPTLNNPMFSLLSSIVAASSITGWMQLQTLIDYTLNNAGGTGGTADSSAVAGNSSLLAGANISVYA